MSDDLRTLLEDLHEYFDGRADAEYFTDNAVPQGNDEMHFLVRIAELLERPV
jgi:hypothetical protein